jgi:nitric oxide reductase large subunit
MNPSDNTDNTPSQEILVAFWGVLIVVLAVLLALVLYLHHKNQKQLHKKLYNFKKAPKNYIDEDSFINNHET